MRKTLTGILFLMLFAALPAGAQYSQYMFNGLVINPAYAGSRDVFSLSGSYAKTWSSFPGAPTRQLVSVHSPLKNDRVALGGNLGARQVGAYKSMYGTFDYAFRILLKNNSVLSLGLSVTAAQEKEDFSGLAIDPSDPVFVDNSVFRPNFGFGAYYYSPRFYVGFSTPEMVTYGLSDSSSTGSFSSFNPADYRFMLTSGYVVGKGALKWKPSVLMQYFGITKDFRLDLNSMFLFLDDRIWLGGSYRMGGENLADQVVAIIEIQITPQFMIGYSYDYSLGAYGSMLGGTHEVFLRFEPVHIIKAVNPKYF
jgi:type IX secretion system PorP/SprF family membrane protein